METLLPEIELFCRAHGMRESRFGREAVRDTNFVSQLRAGRRVWPETAAKVRAFMASYRSPSRRSTRSTTSKKDGIAASC